jgi:hypothetical protein
LCLAITEAVRATVIRFVHTSFAYLFDVCYK